MLGLQLDTVAFGYAVAVAVAAGTAKCPLAARFSGVRRYAARVGSDLTAALNSSKETAAGSRK
jgi:hypothetical protein